MLVSWRQRGHLSWNASIVRSPAHGPVRSTIASVSSSTVSSASASASPMAAMTSSACSGVKRTGSGCIGTDDGRADSAPVHIGRSAVGSRCTVPRGPNVLTRVRSSQSARCTSARVAPAMRRPIDSSAALRTWACAPHSTPAMSAGPRSVAGSVSAWRAIRRAVTPLQVSEAGVRGLRGHGPTFSLAAADIGHIGDGGLGDGTGRIQADPPAGRAGATRRSTHRDHQRRPPRVGIAPTGLLLAQVVILAVIPPGPTAPNQTALNGMPSQPVLPRAYWTGLSGRLSVIS